MSLNKVIGAQIPTVLLPGEGIDLEKWAVIACDQFTSEPEYWEAAAAKVGDGPSTLRMILPEVYLESPDVESRIESIRTSMRSYLDRQLLEERRGVILVERTAGRRTRHGIMLALDLEQYDYSKGSTSLIRATEGTIIERIPPRVRIRSGAPLELPHILVLIDDPDGTVIEPLIAMRDSLQKLYDFDLMLDGGHLTGYFSGGDAIEAQVMDALGRLGEPSVFSAKYELDADCPPMVFAMGDGNHSLATAKAIWEKLKAQVGMDHPARHALVEVENIHDAGLEFEPILRVLFDVKQDWADALERFYPGRVRIVSCGSAQEMTGLVDRQEGPEHAIGVVSQAGCSVVYVSDPPSNLPVGTIQSFLDAWLKQDGFGKIDYVHGIDVTLRLGTVPGNLGFYLPAISKGDFFKTVVVDGALPRKTFSMGEAREKRYYMEARKIS